MLWVAVACGGFWAVWLTVHLPPENEYIPWKQLQQAKRLTVRKDSKEAGFPLTR